MRLAAITGRAPHEQLGLRLAPFDALRFNRTALYGAKINRMRQYEGAIKDAQHAEAALVAVVGLLYVNG